MKYRTLVDKRTTIHSFCRHACSSRSWSKNETKAVDALVDFIIKGSAPDQVRRHDRERTQVCPAWSRGEMNIVRLREKKPLVVHGVEIGLLPSSRPLDHLLGPDRG